LNQQNNSLKNKRQRNILQYFKRINFSISQADSSRYIQNSGNELGKVLTVFWQWLVIGDWLIEVGD
jgi:Tfp pilus assembly ATPase PilU